MFDDDIIFVCTCIFIFCDIIIKPSSVKAQGNEKPVCQGGGDTVCCLCKLYLPTDTSYWAVVEIHMMYISQWLKGGGDELDSGI